jgi:NAD(P)-dependent dehydrogenase (short-subunit alcohol dehydrogenase family)
VDEVEMHNADPGLAVVVGGGNGIGAACCRVMAERGWAIVAADYDEAAASSVASEVDGWAFGVDVRDLAALEALAACIERDVGPVQALVVAAGAFQERVAPTDFPMDLWRHVMQVNAEGTFNADRAFSAGMLRRQKGSIVNIASSAVYGSTPYHAYGPSKAAVVSITAGLAGQWGRSGVRVNSVSPGATLVERVLRRPAARHGVQPEQHMALGRRIQPAEIAESVEFLASERASAITGIDLLVDAGLITASTWSLYGGVPPAEAGRRSGDGSVA